MTIALGMLYHVWYYGCMFVSIVLLSPWLLWHSRSASDFKRFYPWARRWAAFILNGMFLWRKVRYEAQVPWDRPYIVVSNHSSELDVMFCYRLVKSPVVFIGKAELAKIPLFGFFYRRTSILVDRSSLASKRSVMDKAARRLARGTGLCIYPEGGIPKNPKTVLAPFKAGAFKLAIESGTPILPISFPDNRRRFPDFKQGGGPGVLRATVHAPIDVAGLTLDDQEALSSRVHALLLAELERYRAEDARS
jgi:1-acyl-sn-glycerol-3-phosphate acyltransferase